MKIIIIAGGSPPSLNLLQQELTDQALIICADGGANYLFEHKIIPNFIIGDCDSISSSALNFFNREKVPIERHPCAKDQTDTNLALAKALQIDTAITEIVFLGCLGGARIDHLLGNFGLLNKCLQLKIPASFKDDGSEVVLINQSTKIFGKVGQIFSLLPYSEVVTNLSIIGGKYELHNHLLRQGSSLTISNEFLAEEVSIVFDSGKLLVVSVRAQCLKL